MKNIIRFIIFIIYTTLIFFIPNSKIILIFAFINMLVIISLKIKIKKILNGLLKLLPFIIFTFVVNCFLDGWINACFIGIKLILVCSITICYSVTTNIITLGETIEFLCVPLKVFKINTKEIKIMVCISLSMIHILKKEISDIQDICKAKNIKLNIKNMKYILTKFFVNLILRVNQIEDSLKAKGYIIGE